VGSSHTSARPMLAQTAVVARGSYGNGGGARLHSAPAAISILTRVGASAVTSAGRRPDLRVLSPGRRQGECKSAR